MDFGSPRRYEIELWSPSGQRIADISHLCSNRSYTLTRNDAEELSFDLDLYEFEAYCRDQLGGMDPNVLITPYVTDVKVKRNGQYLFGAQVIDVTFTGSPNTSAVGQSGGSAAFAVTISCSGYLNLFKDRYITKVYTQTERTSIASDIITTTQTATNGSVGVTIAANQYQTNALSDRTYSLDNVKTMLQNLAALTDAPFDLSFDPFKAFRAVSKIGARRTDLSFIYGGPVSNVAGFSMSRSGANLFNYIYGLGSGSGDVALVSNLGDGPSQLNYYRREKIDQFSSVILQPTLDQNVAADLALYKDLLELPEIDITTADMPANAPITVGDRIPLKVAAHPWLASVNGLYRVEKEDVQIDENDWESIHLTFDKWGVDQDE